ncbi:hypothetical protein SCLCIDRAFT_12388 [Scleroderma citrinum Foug A]|uniref:Uncharacterized protein n=1 Tax=Scleroderma citrinum Foug A TaxID=1036808 RepID=A0A0C2YK52_9AGAM|nr:hypothetical protein SCLCIDRAFT_12388 [Scleroderma citrinum Foug A]
MASKQQIHRIMLSYLQKTLGDVVLNTHLVSGEQISLKKLQKPRMRVETVLSVLTKSDEKPGEEEFPEEFTEDKLQWCAAMIATAYLNPLAVEWDFDRFCQSTKVGVEWKENLPVFYQMDQLGKVNKPTTIVDRHGKLLVWHLLNIFCLGHMAKFNCAVRGLRPVLEEKSNKSLTWRAQNLVWEQYPLPQQHSCKAKK